jgi:hypothetical protein
MRMHWGYKITVSFILFAGFVFTLVFKMLTSGNDLISAQTYRSGAQVNADLKQLEASQTLDAHFKVGSGKEPGTLELRFEKGVSMRPEGRFSLICLHSAQADLSGTLSLEASGDQWVQTVQPQNVSPGLWLCEIRGHLGGEPFLLKRNFRISNESAH